MEPSNRRRVRPYTLGELSAMADDHEMRIQKIENFGETVDKIWRVLKWGTPSLIAAVLTSGLVNGSWANVLRALGSIIGHS
jgi:hypothetical protein